MLIQSPESPSPTDVDLSFDGLMRRYKAHFSCLPDRRKGSNTTYKIQDAALGAFSVFFMQCPSFLAHQKQLHQKNSSSNAQTLFSMKNIPTDNQIRNILDKLPPELLTPLFDELYTGLFEQGHLKPFQENTINNHLLIALDGTQQLNSKTLHCKNCYKTEHQDGSTTYSHKVITPVIVRPGSSQVISLPPEIIIPQDGRDKQDSEHAASNRWLNKHGKKYKNAGVTILGDDLYAHQPQCESILAQGMDFILTCKKSSHSTMYEWISELDELGKVNEVSVTEKKGTKRFVNRYRFINEVPIRDGEDGLKVNWCELTKTDCDGNVVYFSSFATSHEITEENVAQIVLCGRARWHIENGNNNTLKTKGYHLTHNFGHGKENLSSFLLTLNLLAFLFHTILEIQDECYLAIRRELPSRETFFRDIQALTRYAVFRSWSHLMAFMMEGLEITLINSG